MTLLSIRRESCFMCSSKIQIGDEFIRRRVVVDIKEKTSHPDCSFQQRKYYPYKLEVPVCVDCAADEEKDDD